MKTNKILASVAAMAAAASAGVVFDYSQANFGNGTMAPDDSHYSDSASAQVVLLHADGNYYPAGQGLDIDACPTHDSAQPGTSDCYWGWNNDDMTTDESAKIGVKLMKFASESGWGFTNGGFFYIPDGNNFEDAKPVNIGSGVVVVVKAKAGMPVKIYGKDKKGEYGADEGLPKYGFTGTGAWQTVTAPASGFAGWNGCSNTFNPASVYGIGVEYELSASAQGQPCSQCSDAVIDLEWQKLCFEGDCGVGVSKVASAKQVGFAALRNGLQFSNVGASTLNVQIFNTLGKVVASSKVTAKNSFVSTEALSNGVYVVRATDGAKLNMMRNVTIMR